VLLAAAPGPGAQAQGRQAAPLRMALEQRLALAGVGSRRVYLLYDHTTRSIGIVFEQKFGGVDATLSGSTIFLSVEASTVAINSFLPHIVAAER